MKKEWIQGANPYMPLWEHVPDGEPRVFTYQGETRVYVYGSHDTEKTEYCGRDYVVWSAPVNDLTKWRCHGVCYEAQDHSILYAPDVVQKGDTFYIYAAEQKGAVIRVAKSKTPWGPFTDPVKTDLGFDPGILVDDDGRVYAYWGFVLSHCAELNEDMATIKPGTLHDHPLGHCRVEWDWVPREETHQDDYDAFFEASSPRKIFGKYVYIYSRRVNKPVPELGVHEDCNGFLSYRVSDHPLTGFKDGGDLSFNGGEILKNQDGTGVMTYRWGNNHGSVMNVNGSWYVFYHRHTGADEYARQAMLEPIDAAQDKDGKIYLGKITYRDGEPVSSCPVDMTSQGPHVNGLDARKWISAGYACHVTGGAFIQPVYEQREDISAPIIHIQDGTVAGFRYLQFGRNAPASITVCASASTDAEISVRLDEPGGKEIARIPLHPGQDEYFYPVAEGILGKRAVYFLFRLREGTDAILDRFTFD